MKNIAKVAVATLSNLVFASAVFADSIQSPVSLPSDLGSIFNRIFLFLIGIVGALAIIFIVLGGIRYIIARGDPKATDSARNMITAALIGLVIALLAVAIVVIVGNFLGARLDLTTPTTSPTIH